MTVSAPHRTLRSGLVPRRWSGGWWALDATGRRLLRDRPGLVTVLRALEAGHPREHLDELLEDHAWDTTLEDFLTELEALDALSPVPARRPRIRLKHDRQSAEFVRILEHVAGDRCVLDPFPEDSEDVVVVVAASEPARESFRTLMAARVPHLLVVFDAELVHVGPFVIPGISACIDCFDRHRSRWNPRWPMVVAQAGGPPPLRVGADRVVQTSAVLTLVSWLTGNPPAGTRVTIGPNERDEAIAQFGPDPACHCTLLAPVT